MAHPQEWKHVDYAHQQYMQLFIEKSLVGDLDSRWNCHDGDNLPLKDIWHLHYTNMATQPWRPEWYIGPKKNHPRKDLVELFWHTLVKAKDAGYTPRKRLPDEKKFVYDIIGK